MPLFSKQFLVRISPSTRKSVPDAVRQLRELSRKNLLSREKCDIFLLHRFIDADYIVLLYEALETFGYTVFVDWMDAPEVARAIVKSLTHQLHPLGVRRQSIGG